MRACSATRCSLTSALVPLGLSGVRPIRTAANVVGGAATVQGTGTADRHRQRSRRRAPSSTGTRSTSAPARRTHFVQPGASSITLNRVTGDLGPSQIYGTLTRERPRLRGQSGRHPVRQRRGRSTPPASSPPPTTSPTPTSWRAATISTSRAGPTPRSSTTARSPRTTPASPRWSRPACATPAPSRRPSARSGSPPATASRSIFYGDKLITLGGQRLRSPPR